MYRIMLPAALLSIALQASAADQTHEHNNHSNHATGAPIGIMGDHLHPKDDWMVSYRFMQMSMEGNLKNSNDISTAEIVSPTGENFIVAPAKMTMAMHMFGIMYAPEDNLTLMAMLPYIDNSMDHVTRMGGRFTTDAKGTGDIKLVALYGLHAWKNQHLHLNIGVSAPTGSIDKTDDTPMGNVRLPYPMQLGSGTWDVIAGLTYGGKQNNMAWGAQVISTLRAQSENDNNYRLGNQFEINTWVMRSINQQLAASIRLSGYAWGDVQGEDPLLNKAIVPTADPNLRAGKRLDLSAGINYASTDGILLGHTFGIEVGTPVWQDLDGPQLETDLTVIAGWQFSF